MYHYGYHVKKDEKKYRELIEEAYEEVKSPEYLNEAFPEISVRLAEIKIEDGDKDEAKALLKEAKDFLAERLRAEAFWGHIDVMERIIKDLYGIELFPEGDPDFYDLFHITDRPGTITFKRGLIHPEEYTMEISGDTDRGIRFNDKWYRNFNELCNKGEIDGKKITSIYDELYDFAVEEEEVAS